MSRSMIWLSGLLLLLAACSQEDWGPDHHGQTVQGEALIQPGRWVVLNFWAEWCAPCRSEIPELNRLAAENNDLLVLGVNYDGLQGEALHSAAENMQIAFRVLAKNPAERLGLAPPQGLPLTYILDDQLRLRAELAGEQTAANLQSRLVQLGH